MKIKILHVIAKRPTGGIGTFILNIYENIDRNLIQFDCLINADIKEGEFDKKIKSLGGEIFILPELKIKNIFKYLWNLKKFYEAHNDYKAIHVHTINIGVFNFIFAKIYKIKNRIVHSHSIKYSDKFLNSVRNYILCLPLKYISNIYFACSKKAGIFLFGQNLMNKNKVKVVKNGINYKKFKFDMKTREEYRKKLKIKKDTLIIGHVGMFTKVKNQEFIVEIFKYLEGCNKDLKLILIGNGELREKIENKIKYLNLEDKILILGNRNDVNNWMQCFDILLFPSLFEGIPLTLLEAQAAGLQCFVSNTISNEVKVCNLVNFIDLKLTAEQWGKYILKNYKKNYRPDTEEEFRKNGYKIENIAQELQKIYLGLN